MGGKTWSPMEEHVFWTHIVPKSPKAVDAASRVKSWEECAQEMQEMMADDARRRYTKLMLFEHYFQNISTGHKSPHAKKHVEEHKQQLEMAKPSNPNGASILTTVPAAPSPPTISESSMSFKDERDDSSLLPTLPTADSPPHYQEDTMPVPQVPQMPQRPSMAQMLQMSQMAQMAQRHHMSRMPQMPQADQRPQMHQPPQLPQGHQMSDFSHLSEMAQMAQMPQNYHGMGYPSNYQQRTSSHTMTHQPYDGTGPGDGFIGEAPQAAVSVQYEHALSCMEQSDQMFYNIRRQEP